MLALALLALAASAVLSALITRISRPLLQRYALARPNARSSHRIPTPQGAGIAVIAATLAVASTWAVWANTAIPPILVGATLFIALVGFADDIRPLPVVVRLVLQAASIGAVVFAAPDDLRIFANWPLGLERALLLFAGLWFVNLVNFMDGLDLMTVSEVVPITAAMLLLGWIGELSLPATLVATTLCGAMIGFAPFNRPVAKVFLGDVGSLPIGLLLGWCLLHLAWHQHLAAALLLPAYYLADATVTLFRRVARREPFWAAHRTHFYQRATDHGFGVERVVSEVFTLNLLLAALALLTIAANSTVVTVLAGLSGAGAVVFLLQRFARKRAAPKQR
ncbi:MAG: glycosyltransferase family 4 protein [Bradyrhizobium sp.]|uniref:MraY family glycosyltransferase n=1 Tax=Bradyrhizobium sp. TaxID=376 RepID=UPI0025BAE4A0|nr:glycosyltransferase family 4 protein [Bradyrhizobium sp.]MBI5263821.1 glycosyltransferase family 4 protein [Bradyrhizobium sp.]